MNSKMTTNSQLSTTECKKQKQTKQRIRRGTESEKWRSYGGYQQGWGERGGNGRGHKMQNLPV